MNDIEKEIKDLILYLSIEDGQLYLERYIETKKPADQCQYCQTKIGLLSRKTLNMRFGLVHQVCKDCYKKIRNISKKEGYTLYW